METLMQYPSIRRLNLADNDLDDSAVVFLCYYLEKANRVELQELNLKDNSFGKIGLDAVKGIMARLTNLNVVYWFKWGLGYDGWNSIDKESYIAEGNVILLIFIFTSYN